MLGSDKKFAKTNIGGVDINSDIADKIDEHWFSLILGIQV